MKEINLSVCPNEVSAVDPNARVLWPIFLRKVGLHINSSGAVIENEGRRADIVRRFGVPSLAQRLPAKSNERERARVWWRETIACSAGDSDIPDIAEKNAFVLNAFIVDADLKYPDPRAEQLARARNADEGWAAAEGKSNGRRGRPMKSDVEKRASNALRQRAFRRRKTYVPDTTEKNAIGDESVTV